MIDPFEYCGQAATRELKDRRFTASPQGLWTLSCSLSQQRSAHLAQPPGSTDRSLWSFWVVLFLAFSIFCRCTHTSKARIQTLLSTYPSLLHLSVLWTAAILLSLTLWKLLICLSSGTGQACWRQLHGADAGLICFYLPWLAFTLPVVVSWTLCPIYSVLLWLAWFLSVVPAVISLARTSGALHVVSAVIHIASVSLSSPLAPCFLTTPTTSVHSGALEVADKLELILTSITKLTHAQGKSWQYIYFSESSCRCHSTPPFPFPYRSITHGLHLEKVTF